MVGNIFDSMRNTAVGIVTRTMGYAATWQPTGGGPAQNAIVLFKDPTVKEDQTDSSYNEPVITAEYLSPPYWQALKPSVDGSTKEYVTITVDGVEKIFFVERVVQKFDGRTFVAYLQEKIENV